MAQSSKTSTLVVTIILGIIVIICSAVVMWLKRKDTVAMQELLAKGALTQSQYDAMAPGWGFWVSTVLLVLVGVFIIVWGIVQHRYNTDEAVATAIDKIKRLSTRPTVQRSQQLSM